MGYGITQIVGKGKHDICPECDHLGCKCARKLCDSACVICGKPIGYGAKFYFVGDSKDPMDLTAEHALCAWEKAEKDRQNA